MQKQYSIGFISRSRLAKEMRSPIWYKHLTQKHINNSLIKECIFEQDFGSHTFSESADDYLMQLGCKVLDRFSVLHSSDIVISLKPTDEWEYMRSGSTLVGWLNHLKSPPKNSKNINFLNLEDLNIWTKRGRQKLLYKNAYVAGECGVAQSLEELQHLDPCSPAIREKKLAVVLGYGNLGIGATTELLRQGIEKIVVFTQRQPNTVSDKLEGVEYRQMEYADDNTYEVISEDLKQPLIDSILAQADIIVNATIPSIFQPKWTFIPEDRFDQLKLNMMFIDPVHKASHGADFTHVTELTAPVKRICKSNHSIWYNGCNAMPSYRPIYASYVISEALLNNLESLLEAVLNQQEVLV